MLGFVLKTQLLTQWIFSSPTPQTGDWCHMLSLSMCLVAFHGNYIYPISARGWVEPLSFWHIWTICTSVNVYIYFFASLEGPKRSFPRISVYLRVLLAGTLSWHTFSADTPSSSGLDRAGDKVRSAMTGMWEVKCSDRQWRPLSSELGTLGAKQRVNRNSVHILTFYALWKTILKLITAGITVKTEFFCCCFFCLTAPNNCIQCYFTLYAVSTRKPLYFFFLLHFFPPKPKKLMITSGRTGNRYSFKF